MKATKLKLATMSLVILAGCGDKNVVDNPEGPQGSGTMEVMTPEQSKEFLQDAATEFLNKLNPEDQRAVVVLAAYYDSMYGEYDAPVEFELVPDGKGRTPNRFMKAIGDAAKGDLDALTRAAMTYTYSVKFDQFAGIYEPSSRDRAWVKTGNSNDIIFRFSHNPGQGPVELKVTQSGGVSDVDFTLKDWDYDWDENGNFYEYEEEYKYFLSVPKNVTATLTEDGKELAKTTAVTNIDLDKHKVNANVDATLMNVSATARVEGEDSKVSAQSEYFVSGEKVADAYATVTGNHLCDKDKWQSMEDEDDDIVEAELAKMLKSGDCGGNILDKVQVYGQVSYYKEMPTDLDNYYDYYDYDRDKNKAQQACQDACNRLNKNVKTQLRYNNTKTDQGTLQFVPYFDSWGSDYWEYYISANLLFPDGTSYNVDSYFEKFTNVSNKWSTLLDAYEKIWDSAVEHFPQTDK